MALNVISLSDMIRTIQLDGSTQTEEDIKKLLFSFETLKSSDSSGADDVEFFLHNKAIQFEKMDLARTYLVISTFRSKAVLAGYFSIANKPLTIPRRQFHMLSKSMQKRLMGVGHRTEQQSFVITGYLLGQLGKNFSEDAQLARSCNGSDLLQLVYRKVAEAHRIMGGRILYLECEDNDKIISFYRNNGFSLIEQFQSENGYRMMVKQLKDLL